MTETIPMSTFSSERLKDRLEEINMDVKIFHNERSNTFVK